MVLGWRALIFFIIFILLLASIVFMLVTLARRGDERNQLIKTKAMSTTFLWTVAILLFETVRMFATTHPNDVPAGTNPFLLLLLISFIFLISLIVYKKKFGD